MSTRQTTCRPIKDASPYAYGEILEAGVVDLIESMQLTEKDVFVDIGSGKGLLCKQIFSDSLAQKVIGIEPVLKRHNLASPMTTEGNDRSLYFVHGCALETVESWADATVLFMNNFAFPDELTCSIFEIIHNQCKKARMIIVAKPPEATEIRARYNVHGIEKRIRASWGSTKAFQIWKPLSPVT